jgi:tetratricopeptide (TPR) repeat protein
MAMLLTGVVGLQAVREQRQELLSPAEADGSLLYVSSPKVVSKAALSYQSLVADVYWIRALQHFGQNRLAAPDNRTYALLFPLLDLTTSLDPRFKIAYRFGAIFLAEAPPGGPGRPDLAIALLKKGLEAQPERWEFAHDIGFVHYRQGDYAAAADWFGRAAAIPGAAGWLQPLEAVTRTRGGDRATARRLWSELLKSSEDEWLRNEAARRLRQLDALDMIDAVTGVVSAYRQRTGTVPRSWADLIHAGYLRGIPVDPDARPLVLNPYWGVVTLDPASPLLPLPTNEESTL